MHVYATLQYGVELMHSIMGCCRQFAADIEPHCFISLHSIAHLSHTLTSKVGAACLKTRFMYIRGCQGQDSGLGACKLDVLPSILNHLNLSAYCLTYTWKPLLGACCIIQSH